MPRPTVRTACSLLLLVVSSLAATPLQVPAASPGFVAAQPVWPVGRERELNVNVAFRALVPAPADGRATLRLAGHALYRVYVNGRFAGHGPARAAHGFFRIDEWDLSPHLRSGDNLVAVEVAGYNATSFWLINETSFLQAEVVSGDAVLASTAGPGRRFEAAVMRERVQRVQRYSFQRPFTEIWRLTPGWDAWRYDAKAAFSPVACAVVAPKQFLSRGVPYPSFAVHPAVALVGAGAVVEGAPPAKPWRDHSLTHTGPKLTGFPEAELESIPTLELQAVHTASTTAKGSAYAGGPVKLAANSWATFDLGLCRAGFIGAHLEARQPTRLFFTFDEILTDGDVSFTRMGCANVVTCELAPGTYDFSSFEPYGLRYLKLIVLEGDCEVSQVGLRELTNPEAARATFAASDDRLNRIFAAARETFAQNAVDIFMDCPSRERGGWLCDSFFTARVAADLAGTTSVEKKFSREFPAAAFVRRDPGRHAADVLSRGPSRRAIHPSWAMWLVLELDEYAARSGDHALVAAFGPRLHTLLAWFRPHENADGLLEKMPGWNFIEWSKANSYIRDVELPDEHALRRGARRHGPDVRRAGAREKGGKLRETIRRQSFDGEFFVDNAERREGQLRPTRNRSEACQDYAFYFGVATPATHPELWRRLRQDFGPQRASTQAWPEVAPANAFIGNQLRFELLARHGLRQQILDEAAESWLYMADRHRHAVGERAGVRELRPRLRVACRPRVLPRYPRPPENRPRRPRGARGSAGRETRLVRGAVPTHDGPVELSWRHEGTELAYQVRAPAGWKVDVVNESGREIVRN
jgi:alpha-L-rhamnosidase